MSFRPSAWDDVQIEYVNKIISEYGIKRLFETGTFHGVTALYFRAQGLDVFTVENNSEFFMQNLEMLAGSGILPLYGDSRSYLKGYTKTMDLSDTLFFLDAHWGKDCPLKGELETLDTLESFVAICHDVAIIEHPQFQGDIDVTEQFNGFMWSKPTRIIYPRYNVPMPYHPHRLVGYVIVIRGYPMIPDERFFTYA